ncbi:hypothetical protein JIN86_05595 [Lysinibacillus sp. HST-98]|uniref:hypothetical protein n=1 Tax=Lysinibacillus sp. HST-98 TaxID=2800419 RepID=UPI001927B724|nr:hypothetical protein [Lysinibacillus sp. HST-98]MBL3729071.1 hypothetical protein [Lysinibacillus sp. HST-98]
MDDDKLLQLFNQLTQSNKDYVLNIVESLLKNQDLFKDFVPDSQREKIIQEEEIKRVKVLLNLD